MIDPLTDKWLAEARKTAEGPKSKFQHTPMVFLPGRGTIWATFTRMASTVPALLDEVERLKGEVYLYAEKYGPIIVKCEGCQKLLDVDNYKEDCEGVPLCDKCFDELVDEAKKATQ